MHVTKGDPDSTAPAVDEAFLDRLRRGFALALDRTGRFTFEGDPITHAGIRALFWAGVDLNDEGEPIVRVDSQWTYLNPEDCVYRVSQVLGQPPEIPRLRVDDGREVEALPGTWRDDDEGGISCAVPSLTGRPLSARLSNRAAMELSHWIEFDADEAAWLVFADRREALASSAAG